MLEKRSFSLSGHRTSIALEPQFWAVLQWLAVARELKLSRLVVEIDASRAPNQPLASALRVLVLQSLLAQIKPPGEDAPGGI